MLLLELSICNGVHFCDFPNDGKEKENNKNLHTQVSIIHKSQLPTLEHSLSRQLCMSLGSVSITWRKTYTKGSARSSNDAVYCVDYTQKKEASAVNEGVTLCWQYSNYIAQFKLYSVSHVCVCVYIYIYM